MVKLQEKDPSSLSSPWPAQYEMPGDQAEEIARFRATRDPEAPLSVVIAGLLDVRQMAAETDMSPFGRKLGLWVYERPPEGHPLYLPLAGTHDFDSRVDVEAMPQETHDLLDGLYTLTGASVVRDDLTKENPFGSVVRKGAYAGRTVYFKEEYFEGKSGKHPGDHFYGTRYFHPETYKDGPADPEGRRLLEVEVLGEVAGEDALHAPTSEQMRQLTNRLGEKAHNFTIRRLSNGEYKVPPLITIDNFELAMELISVAGEVAVKTAEDEKVAAAGPVRAAARRIIERLRD